MVEQRPFTGAVRTASQKDLKGVMPFNTDAASASMPQQILHLRSPLRMRSAAKAKAVSKEAGPIFACPQIAFREPCAPQIFGPILAVRVMRVAPKPGSQRLAFIALRHGAHGALILFSLGGAEPFKGRTRQLARIPRMVGAHL